MDSPKSSQQSSLESLRTVEFRQTLRGYHIDDVDEYLERVAVDAEALQEQLRQANERTKQAADRIAQLEGKLAEREEAGPAEREPTQAVTDDTLQRTLLMAQQFVDQTKEEAAAEARETVLKAEDHARRLMADAEARARSVTDSASQELREEVERLKVLRTRLAEDAQLMSEHIESERTRLHGALVEMLSWVDKQMKPATAVSAGRSEDSGPISDESGPSPSGDGEGAQAPAHEIQRPPAVQPAGGGF
jgi:cell division initiation protein